MKISGLEHSVALSIGKILLSRKGIETSFEVVEKVEKGMYKVKYATDTGHERILGEYRELLRYESNEQCLRLVEHAEITFKVNVQEVVNSMWSTADVVDESIHVSRHKSEDEKLKIIKDFEEIGFVTGEFDE